MRAESNADSFLKRVLEGAVTGTDRDGRVVGSCLMGGAALLLALARVGDGVAQVSAYRSPACHPPSPSPPSHTFMFVQSTRPRHCGRLETTTRRR